MQPKLSPREQQILEILGRTPGKTVPRHQLEAELGGTSLDGVVHRLRQKIESDPKRPRAVLTEHGDGLLMAFPEPAELRLAAGRVNLAERWVERDGERQSLTTKEARLLGYLAANPGRVVPPDELLSAVWRVRTRQTEAVKTTIWRLRRKLESDPGRPRHLLTAPGGYRLETMPAEQAPRATVFVGREQELATLRRWIAEGARTVQILGPPGVGKSALCNRLLLELHARGDQPFEVLDGDGLAQPVGRRLLLVGRAPVPAERVLRLGPLPPAEAARLYHALTDAPLPAGGLLAATDGFPGAVVALARSEGPDEQAARDRSTRRAGLGADTRRALDALASLPGPFPPELGAWFASEGTLEALFQQGLLERTGERLWVPAQVRALCARPRGVAQRQADWVLDRIARALPVSVRHLEGALETLVGAQALVVLRVLREILWERHQHEAIVRWATRLLERQDTTPQARADLYWMRAGSCEWLGRWALAMQDVESGLDAAREAGDRTKVVALLSAGSLVAFGLGHDERAQQMADQAQALVDPDDLLTGARVTDTRSRCALYANRPEVARQIAWEGLERLEQAMRSGRLASQHASCSHRRWELLVCVGLAHRELGQSETAIGNFEEALRLDAPNRSSDMSCWTRMHLAATLADAGRFAEAESLHASLLQAPQRQENVVLILFNRAVARAVAGDVAAADLDLGQARTLGQSGVHQVIRGQVSLALAAMAALQGRTEQARALLSEGCRGLPVSEQQYLGLREVAEGCLAAALGQLDAAAAHLAAAREHTRRPYWRVLAKIL